MYFASLLCSSLIIQIYAFQKYYVVDDKLKDYVMGSAHKKWRDFKEDLKQKFFKPEETDEDIYALIRIKDNRVSEDDCEWLVKFWRSEEAEKQSEQGKKNRSAQKTKQALSPQAE
jgi:hypothetical protein